MWTFLAIYLDFFNSTLVSHAIDFLVIFRHLADLLQSFTSDFARRPLVTIENGTSTIAFLGLGLRCLYLV